MRNTSGVFRDAAIVGERCYRFSVLEARCAQGNALGLEDGDTGFAISSSRYFFQQCHGTGSRLKKLRGGAGHPSPPLRALTRPRRFDWMTGRTSNLSTVLLGRSLRHRYNGHVGAAFSFRCELNLSIDEREQGVIFAGADVTAGMPFGAALTRKDIAGEHDLAAGRLQAEPPARRVASVT